MALVLTPGVMVLWYRYYGNSSDTCIYIMGSVIVPIVVVNISHEVVTYVSCNFM